MSYYWEFPFRVEVRTVSTVTVFVGETWGEVFDDFGGWNRFNEDAYYDLSFKCREWSDTVRFFCWEDGLLQSIMRSNSEDRYYAPTLDIGIQILKGLI